MSTPDTPRTVRAQLSLSYGDPVAVELTSAIHGGNLDALRRIVADRPELASAHMIGRKGLEGGWRTSLHAASDWPGYFPAAPAAVVMLLEAGADPNDDTGGDRPETPLHWAASTDDVDVAVVLIDNGADLETPGGSIGSPLDNAIGYGCWHVGRLLVARGARVDKLWHAAALGLLGRIEQLVGERPRRPAKCPRRSGTPALAVNDALPSTYSLKGRISTGLPTTPKAPRWIRPVLWAPARRTSSAGCGSKVLPQQNPRGLNSLRPIVQREQVSLASSASVDSQTGHGPARPVLPPLPSCMPVGTHLGHPVDRLRLYWKPPLWADCRFVAD